MPISQPTFKPSDLTVNVSGADKVSITNLSVPSTGTEVSQLLQTGLKQLTVRSRVLATIQLAFVSTESATKYITLKPGAVLELIDLDFTAKTIYAQSDTITTLEIMELYT